MELVAPLDTYWEQLWVSPDAVVEVYSPRAEMTPLRESARVAA
jgi:hypothetical protein